MGQVMGSMIQNRGMYDNTAIDDRDTTNANKDYTDADNSFSNKATNYSTIYLPQHDGGQRTMGFDGEGSLSAALWKTSVNEPSAIILPKRSWDEQTPLFLQYYGWDSGMLYSLPDIVQSLLVRKRDDYAIPPLPDSITSTTTASYCQQQHNSIIGDDATSVYQDFTEELVALMDQHKLTIDNISTTAQNESPIMDHRPGSSVSPLPPISFSNLNNMVSSTFDREVLNEANNDNNQSLDSLDCQFTFTYPRKEYKLTGEISNGYIYGNPDFIDTPKPTNLEATHQRKILPLPTPRRRQTSAIMQPIPQVPSSTEFTFESTYPSTSAYSQETRATDTLFSHQEGHQDDLYSNTKKVKLIEHVDTDQKDHRINKNENRHESTLSSLPLHFSTRSFTIDNKQPFSDLVDTPTLPDRKKAKPSSPVKQKPSSSEQKNSSSEKKKNKRTPATNFSEAQDDKKIRQKNTSQPSSIKRNSGRSDQRDSLNLVSLDKDDSVCLFCQYEIFKNGWLTARKRQIAVERRRQQRSDQRAQNISGDGLL